MSNLKGTMEAYLSMVSEASKLDAVDKKAVKKDFDDRKDKDIDNDGDTDSSDEYLHKRRKAISKEVESEADDKEQPDIDTDPKKAKEKKSQAEASCSGSKRKMESSDAYGKSMERMRDKKKKKDMSSDDKNKLSKVADMLNKEKMKKESVEEISEARPSVPVIKQLYSKMLMKCAKSKEANALADAIERLGEFTGKSVHSGNSAGLAKAMFDDMLEVLEVRSGMDEAKQGPDPKDQEKLEPRAPAEKDFVNKHGTEYHTVDGEADANATADSIAKSTKAQAPSRMGKDNLKNGDKFDKIKGLLGK